MNALLRSAFLLVPFLLALAMPADLWSQQARKDTVEIIQTPGSRPYQCCYSFNVGSRQRRGSTISEFTVRIVSGRARFLTGQASSPTDWTVFTAQDLMSVSWYATSQASEIDSGESVPGFSICAADTGIMRLVWETRTIDTLFSTDTIAVACRGIECDEIFFRQVPSNRVCMFDADFVGGNRRAVPINELRFRMLTQGATFVPVALTQPAGWSRIRSTQDSIVFYTNTNPIDFGEFVEGFRVQTDAIRDSAFRILWTTYSYGEPICIDTATLVCRSLVRSDTVRMSTAAGTCCQDLTLLNSHDPASNITRLALKVLTPGVRISAAPTAPAGWTRSTLGSLADSVSYAASGSLAHGDSLALAGLCFDNTDASTDVIRFRWETFGGVVPIAQDEESTFCLRPLTRCDTVTVSVDSTIGAAQRCVSLTLTNRNSREESIQRFAVRISNPGTPRRILTATAAAGWTVQSVGRDSVVFVDGGTPPGISDRFDICLSNNEPGYRDPLTISWQTAGATAPLCAGVVQANAIILNNCDTMLSEERSSPTPGYCCYTVGFVNANSKGRTLDGFQLEVGNTAVAFIEAGGMGPWVVVDTTFPLIRLGFAGGTVAPGDTTPFFRFCIDARQIPARPATLPLTWRSYSGGQLVCSGTVELTCVGEPQQCDTALLISSAGSGTSCTYSFALANQHTPASTNTELHFHLRNGGRFSGASATGQAAGFTQVSVRPDTVVFRGDSILTSDTVGTFILEVADIPGASVTFEVCTFHLSQAVCCDIVSVPCGVGGVAVPLVPSGFVLHEAEPNPASNEATIRYELRKAGPVSMVLRDDRGRIVRELERGYRTVGDHRVKIDLGDVPSGVYFFQMAAGGESFTRSLTVVR